MRSLINVEETFHRLFSTHPYLLPPGFKNYTSIKICGQVPEERILKCINKEITYLNISFKTVKDLGFLKPSICSS